jgi:hypothetical protein
MNCIALEEPELYNDDKVAPVPTIKCIMKRIVSAVPKSFSCLYRVRHLDIFNFLGKVSRKVI